MSSDNPPSSTTPFTGSGKPPGKPGGWIVPGEVVAERYRIEGLLGEGGMGAVYAAQDLELEEEVAIKVLQVAPGANSEKMLSRFKQEIRLARRIVHPNVCRIYEFGSWGKLKFVTMELVRGETLSQLMKRPDDLDLDAKLALFQGMLEGLDAAHQIGIIHRDIKPQNIMITPEGRPVIMDFGIARDLSSDGMTATGEVIGTPVYMAPERLLGKEIDHRCDLYSFGVILFELATGSKPFAGNTIFEIAKMQLSKPPPRPTEVDADVPPWLERVILKMLAKQPEDRFQSVAEVVAELAPDRRKSLPRVLVVDDDPEFLFLLERHLGDAGFEVLSAKSGAEGIEQMMSRGADLVCLDFKMPEMDGFFVADYLHKLDPLRKVPIFMVTGMQDPQYEKQASTHGIERFYVKPLDLFTLAADIKQRLGV